MSRPLERWIAEREEPLGELLARASHASALAEGRVFVDGRRASDARLLLTAGARVEIYAARSEVPKFRIVHAEGGLVFVEKPVGIATEPERRGAEHALVPSVARELGMPAERVSALSRLDVAVSGIVLLATNSEASRRVLALREQGRFERRYVALSAGVPAEPSGLWSEPIGRRGQRRAVLAGGQPARTRFRVCGAALAAKAGVLALRPLTGRTHQLRVHAAEHGAPLLGDATYGGPRRVVLATGSVLTFARILLHAAWFRLGDAEPVAAPLPEEFEAASRALALPTNALSEALSAELAG